MSPDRSSGRPRHSRALAIALVASFVSLSGIGWAASSLPPNSVGTKQLQDRAVTGPKLARRVVAAINRTQVQARIRTSCPAGNALTSVRASGRPGCSVTGPALFARGSSRTRLVRAGQLVEVKKLTIHGSFLVVAYPEVTVKSGLAGQTVTVTCKLGLTSGAGAAQSSALRFDIGPFRRTQAASMPLLLALSSVPVDQTAGLRCSGTTDGGATPGIFVTASIDAVEL